MTSGLRNGKNAGSATRYGTQGLWLCAPVLWPLRPLTDAEYSTAGRLIMSALHSWVTAMLRLVCWEWINWCIYLVRISQLRWIILSVKASRRLSNIDCTAENKATNAVKAANYVYHQRKASFPVNTNCQLIITTWWKTAREIPGFGTDTSSAIHPLLNASDGYICYWRREKAELFNNVLVNENTFCIRRPALLGPSCTKSVFCIDSVTVVEVAQAERSLPNKPPLRATGYLIGCKKRLVPESLCLLHFVQPIPCSFCCTGDEQKTAVVTPVSKTADCPDIVRCSISGEAD